MENWKVRDLVWATEAAVGGIATVIFPEYSILIIWITFSIVALIIVFWPRTHQQKNTPDMRNTQAMENLAHEMRRQEFRERMRRVSEEPKEK